MGLHARVRQSPFHAVRQFEKLGALDPELFSDIRLLRRQVEN